MNFLQKLAQKGKAVAAGAVATVASGAAMAQSDYDPITTAVDWADVGTAAIAIMAGVAAVYVLFRGGRMILGAIKR